MNSDDDEHDLKMGRAIRWFARFYGGSLVVCLILVWILGENGPYRDWILAGSLLGGLGIALWLGRAEKKARQKQEAALQSKNDVVE